jgi:hypothetical protein
MLEICIGREDARFIDYGKYYLTAGPFKLQKGQQEGREGAAIVGFRYNPPTSVLCRPKV